MFPSLSFLHVFSCAFSAVCRLKYACSFPFFLFLISSTRCIRLVPSLFFSMAFKVVVDSWKFSILLLYILWDDWQIFMISGSNEQLQQQLQYPLLKPDCHSWSISKMQSGREDALEEWYAIKFCSKFGKKAAETYGMLQNTFWHELSISFWVA